MLLESDLLYENRALSTLLAFSSTEAILVSGFTQSGDEVYIETKDDYFYRMSKKRHELQQVIGELVGICKISPHLFNLMISYSERYFQDSFHLHYEEGCLNQVAQHKPISICFVNDLLWCEIDNADHLHRAQHLIWPQIRRQDGNVIMMTSKHSHDFGVSTSP